MHSLHTHTSAQNYLLLCFLSLKTEPAEQDTLATLLNREKSQGFTVHALKSDFKHSFVSFICESGEKAGKNAQHYQMNLKQN